MRADRAVNLLNKLFKILPGIECKVDGYKVEHTNYVTNGSQFWISPSKSMIWPDDTEVTVEVNYVSE